MRTRSARKSGKGSRRDKVSDDEDYNPEPDIVDAASSEEGANTKRAKVFDDEDYNPESDLVDAASSEEDLHQYVRYLSEGSDDDDDVRCDARLTRLALGRPEYKEVKVQKKEKSPEFNEVNVLKEVTRPKRRECKRRKVLLGWEVCQGQLEESLSGIKDDNEFDPSLRDSGIPETLETPSELTMPLLRFQKEWLAWAVKQEESEFRGGILADEMGMGKTVQAISLVLHSRSKSSESTSKLSKTKCTLVVCPLVAAIQWINEIGRFTAPGTSKVLLYHGPTRTTNVNDFMNYDFVVTTYSIVESEYRKNVMPPKEKCRWCGKLLHPHKMDYHLKRFCGPNAQKTEKQSKQEKKRKHYKIEPVLCDLKSELLAEDDDVVRKGQQSKMKTPRKAKRPDRVRASRDGPSNVLRNESPSDRWHENGGKSALHSIKWERIILDEAHSIKARYCNTARAVFALQSSYRWALSGTPLQNRVGELYSLIRYLQVYPYSYYFCKECECRLLDYRFDYSGDKCQVCDHTGARHFCWWNKYVAKPIQSRGYRDDGKRAMILLKHKVLKSLVLRRTKKGRAADLVLPPRTVTLRQDYMDFKEEDFYEALYTQSQSQFNTYVAKGTLTNNYAHIFELLTRLRQAVDHPYLVVCSSSNQNEKADAQSFCGLCGFVSDDPVVTSCQHTFCRECLISFCGERDQCVCPDQSCTKLLTLDLNKSMRDVTKFYKRTSILSRICLEDFQTSTKIDALKEEVRFMVEKDRAAKAIVFSQFTSFLDLINHALLKAGVRCVLLVGSMSIKARDDAIKTFTDDPECRVFLMSLKAGGVALNLTVASSVFLMDPWWNPAVEQQAQDRIHRIGQFKPIRVVRFVIANTIEERILKLQEKKQLVFEGTVGGSSEALAKLTEEDLQFLFQN